MVTVSCSERAAPVQVVLDGSDPQAANVAVYYAQSILEDFARHVTYASLSRDPSRGPTQIEPVDARVRRIYRQGDPAGEIINAAEEHNADLIIMGSRGLGQVGGLILGSVSERVLHGAYGPVLIVR